MWKDKSRGGMQITVGIGSLPGQIARPRPELLLSHARVGSLFPSPRQS